MCGIVGFVGLRNCADTLIDQLSRLEYRGYDSAGLAVLDRDELRVVRSVGKIRDLRALLNVQSPCGQLGICHTRWATHGAPSTRNSHPHVDCTGGIAVVHNGIIENYLELRHELQSRGHIFKSETDTEVIPHLIEDCFDGDLVAAVRSALPCLHGSYAIAVVSKHAPDMMVAARKDSPLVIGVGDGENYLASDIPALLGYTREVIAMEDGDMAVLTGSSISIMTIDGTPVERKTIRVTWDAGAAEKSGYDHFMLKEIHEEPAAVRDTLRGRITPDDSILLDEISLSKEQIQHFDRVFMVSCGTAYYAGCVGEQFMEQLVGMPVEVDLASEFRYRNPILNERTLIIGISQSGETADTLAALRMAKKAGASTISIVNVVGSTMSRETDNILYTRAGPEICVASTKAYVSQLIALYLLALYLAKQRGTITREQEIEYTQRLRELPELVSSTLEIEQDVALIAEELAGNDHCFYLGRGLDYAVSMEGALKLKEISYVHAEAYAAGEMKHGPLALITRGTPVICLATQDHVRDKLLSNVKEVQARGAKVLGIAKIGDPETHQVADFTINIPATHDMFMPVLAVVPLQLLAYYTARHLGRDIDQPRNLAKSVTVE